MNDHLVVGRIDMKDKWFIIVLTVVLFIGVIGFHKLDNKYEAIKKANADTEMLIEIAKKFENESISNVLREALNAYEETL